MDEAFAREVLFSLWSPIVAITAAASGKRSAFIATSVTCASFGPPCPLRVTLHILKLNYTYELVQESGAFAVHLLSRDQMELVRTLGTVSGRERDKLATLPHTAGVTGSPLLNQAVAYLDCRVANQMDAGDRTVFLADVVDGRRIRPGDLLTNDYFLANAPPEWLEEYRAHMAPLRPAIAEMARQVRRGC